MMIKNQLKVIVLKKLDEKSLSGYDLIKEIYSSTGTWKPSFGSIYPLLKDMDEKGLVRYKSKNRKKIYSITASGRKSLKEAILASKNMIETMAREFKMMESICSPEEKRHLDELIKKIHTDQALFGNLTDEIDRLQRILLHLLMAPDVKSKEDKIKIILNDTITRLKKV